MGTLSVAAIESWMELLILYRIISVRLANLLKIRFLKTPRHQVGAEVLKVLKDLTWLRGWWS
jgi:hypothetical protein